MEVRGKSALLGQGQGQGVCAQVALATLEGEVRKLGGGGAVRAADVAALRSWLRTQPHLPADLISDVDVVLAYWSCQCSPERTKQLLDLHFTLRTLFTTFFRERRVDAAAEQAFRTVLMAPLRAATAGGARGVYCRLLPPADPASFHFDQAIRAFMLMFDVWQQREGAWPSFAILIDMQGVTLAHVARIPLPSLRQVLYFLQEAMLVRLQEVHFLNAPSFMDRVLALLRPFMKRELQDMIRVHQPGATSLHEHVPPDAFPLEPHHELAERLVAQLREGWAAAWLRAEEGRRVREHLRPPSAPAHLRAAHLALDLCPQGSFKQLDLD